MSNTNTVPAIVVDATATEADLRRMLAEAQAENARLKSKTKGNGITLKVSPKGGVSVYGFGRFPVTLYKSQWDKLIGVMPEIQEFIATNAHLLSVKEA